MKPVVLQTLKLDGDGHVQGPSGVYYRIDCFHAFHYHYTPPQHDQNQVGHVAILGLRNGAGHVEEEQVLLFEENGFETEEEAQDLLRRALRRMGFDVWDSFP